MVQLGVFIIKIVDVSAGGFDHHKVTPISDHTDMECNPYVFWYMVGLHFLHTTGLTSMFICWVGFEFNLISLVVLY